MNPELISFVFTMMLGGIWLRIFIVLFKHYETIIKAENNEWGRDTK